MNNINLTITFPEEIVALLRRIADQTEPAKKATRKTGVALSSVLVQEQPVTLVTKTVTEESVVDNTPTVDELPAATEPPVSTEIDPEVLRVEIRALLAQGAKDGKKDKVHALLAKHGGSKLSDIPVLNLPLLLEEAKVL